jgi:hypothetical protein
MKTRLALFVFILLITLDAEAVTGFLVGERTQGLSRLCFYDVLGETYSISVSAASLCPLNYNFAISPPNPNINTPPAGGKTGFLNGERTQGLSKICFYDVLGETYTINVSAASVCPVTYKF